MMSSFKSRAALYWVLIVVFASLAVFVYLIKEDSPRTIPKIGLSYFKDAEGVAESIHTALAPEFGLNKFYWLGVEPDKAEYIDLTRALIKKLKTQQTFQKIIVDKELGLDNNSLIELGFTDVVSVKENLYSLGEKLQGFEKNNISYILVTAAIYTNTLLKKNPLDVLKEKYNLSPLTFSMAYFAISADDEKNMVFQCRTDDQTGTGEWGCIVVNRARFARKKIASNNTLPWLGLMDSSTEKNYILIMKKNEK